MVRTAMVAMVLGKRKRIQLINLKPVVYYIVYGEALEETVSVIY